GLAIDSTVDIFTFYVPHRHVYGEQWIKFMKDGVNATPLPTVNTTGYIDHAAFLGTINPDSVLITLLNVTLIILTLSVSRLLNLLLRLVAFLLFLNPQCLASISRWITASSSWKRFCLFVCRALSSIMVICMLTAIRLLLTFVM